MIKAVIVRADSSESLLNAFSQLSFPNFKVMGEAMGIRDGIHMIQTFRPKLAILDIESPDSPGWHVFEATKSLDYDKIVFSSKVLSAFRILRFDVGTQIKKPFQPVAIREMVEKLLFSKGELGIQRLYRKTFKKQVGLDQVVMPGTERTRIVRTADISRIEAVEQGAEVYFVDGRCFLTTLPLGKLTHLLAYAPFFRVNSRTLIRLHSGVGLMSQGDRTYACLSNSYRVLLPVGRVRALKDRLSRLHPDEE